MRRLRALAATLGLLAILLAHAPAIAQQTVAQYNCIGETLFCEQDLDALDRAAKLAPSQREAIASIMRGALAKQTTLSSRLSRESSERWSKRVSNTKGTPEEAEKTIAEVRAEGVKDAVGVWAQIAGFEREALNDIRQVLTKEQLDKGWPVFERFRRRLIIDQQEGGSRIGHNPLRIAESLKLDDKDAAAIAPIRESYELRLDEIIRARMAELDKINRELATTGEVDPNTFDRPGMQSREIARLNAETARRIEAALSQDAKERFIRQRVGTYFGGIERIGKDDWTKHMMALDSLTDDQKARMAQIVAKGDQSLYATLLAGVRECDDVALRDTPSDDARHVFHEVYRRAIAGVNDSRAEVRAVLTPLQLEQLDAEITAKNGPPDPFKEKRRPDFESPWLEKPSKPAK